MGVVIDFQRLDDVPDEYVEKKYPVKIRIKEHVQMHKWTIMVFQEQNVVELVPIAKATISGQSFNAHDMYSIIISCLIVDGFNVISYPTALISNHDTQPASILK